MLSAAENVGIPLRIAGVRPSERRERVAAMLALTGLSSHAAHRPDELSGGQQQRVAIARALAGRPGLLIADEPTSQLDLETGRQIMELLLSVVRSEGITALVATHDEALIDLADKVIVAGRTGCRRDRQAAERPRSGDAGADCAGLGLSFLARRARSSWLLLGCVAVTVLLATGLAAAGWTFAAAVIPPGAQSILAAPQGRVIGLSGVVERRRAGCHRRAADRCLAAQGLAGDRLPDGRRAVGEPDPRSRRPGAVRAEPSPVLGLPPPVEWQIQVGALNGIRPRRR